MIVLTSCATMHRLRPDALRLRWYWRRGDDTMKIADALGIATDAVWKRVWKHRQRGYDLPMRTRHETCAKRRQTAGERVCGCGRSFRTATTHRLHSGVAERQCPVCRDREYGEEFVRV